MQNPILQMLNGNSQQNQMIEKLKMLKNLMEGKTPEGVYNYLMQTSPQFKKFIQDNQGKTIEDIAMDYDIDLDLIRKFM